MSAITAKASRKMKKYAVLTREPRCFLGSFDFSWEQRKLEDYLTVSVEKNTGNIYGRSDVLSVSGDYGIVNQIEFQGRSFAGASVSNYGVVQTGDVVYTKSPLNSNPYGIIKTNKGKPGIVSTLYAVYHPKENAFSDFIQVYFEQHARMNNYMHPLVNKGAKNDMKVSAENALKGPVCFPSRIEQESVSAFFSVLDNLITLHQRKCANLCSPSQVVFSLLFATSTFSWEQRKLGELALFNPKDELPQTFEYVDLESVVGTEMLSHRTEVKSSAPSRAQRLAHTGDLFYQTVRPYQKNNYLFEKPDNNYVFSTGYAQMRPYVDGYFLLSLVQSERFVKVVLDNCTGTSYPAINANDLAEIEVAAPSDESEAQKIGTIFRSIDNLITLHQRECISFTGRADRLILTANKKRTTSSWEQRKLGELGKITTGSTPSTSIPDYYSDDGIVWVTPTDICENITFESARKLSDLGQQVGRVVPKNTILVTCIASIGKNTMLGNTGSFNQQINGLTPNENESDPYFLLTESALWSAKMKSSAATGTMQIVNRTEFSELKTWLPSLIEQQAISDFFRQLDYLITLHQRKLEEMKKQKKALMQLLLTGIVRV